MVITSKSMTGVAGSSIFRMAECAPAVGLAVTDTVIVLFSGTETEPSVLNVPSLPAQLSLWVTALAGPLVRVILIWYVLAWPGFWPPSVAAHRL